MNAKLWLQQQLLPLLKDSVNDLEQYGFPDETLDKIEGMILLLKRNSKPFRKTVSYFVEEGATTPTVAVQEITGATIKTIRKTLDDLYEVGACGCEQLATFKPSLPKTRSKARIYYLEKSFIPLFFEKHYNSRSSDQKPVYHCKTCGFEKSEYELGEVCMRCYQERGKLVKLELKV